MATRPVFMARNTIPYVNTVSVDFTFNSGQSASQKKKNVTAIHDGFTLRCPDAKVLEISSKSMQDGGVELSAFNLKKYVPSLGRSVPVECIYHAGKVFKNGGPYTDLIEKSPREAKRDERLQSSGELVGFSFEGMDFPLRPATAFYDFLYINALMENEEAAKTVLKYDAFTDIEYNPNKSIACQAKAAAIFVSLERLGLLEDAKTPEGFLQLFKEKPVAGAAAPVKEEVAPTPALETGNTVTHKIWGDGTVVSVANGIAVMNFASVGEKKLGVDWVVKNCAVN